MLSIGCQIFKGRLRLKKGLIKGCGLFIVVKRKNLEAVLRPFVFNEGICLQGLDYVIVEARRNHIRLILSLVNNLVAFGGKNQYVKWAKEAGVNVSLSDDSFFSNPVIKDYYKAYIKVRCYVPHL